MSNRCEEFRTISNYSNRYIHTWINGYWILDTGYWILVAGGWGLVAG